MDPHSVYLSKEELRSSEESLRGEFSGVGIQYFLHKDSIFIVSVTKGGPSDIAGIKGGDRIIRVNDDVIFGKHINHSIISQKLRGNKGESVIITVYRKLENKTITFNVKRDNIKISSLDACYMATPDIAYVRINILKRVQETGQTENIDTKFFTVTFYKKGTCHLVFKDMELLKKFNLYAGRKLNFLPGDYGKKAYEDEYRDWETDRKSTRLNSSHSAKSRMPSSA